MATNDGEVQPDSEATKWFTIAIIGTILYVSAVFAFVIMADEPSSDSAEVKPAPAAQAVPGEATNQAAEGDHER